MEYKSSKPHRIEYLNHFHHNNKSVTPVLGTTFDIVIIDMLNSSIISVHIHAKIFHICSLRPYTWCMNNTENAIQSSVST